MKAYKLMKVVEGQYNIRRSSDNGLVGSVNQSGENWLANVLGKSAKLKSKAKALGFVRGVFAAFTGTFANLPEPVAQNSATSQDAGGDYDSRDRNEALIQAVEDIKDGLDALVAAVS